DRGTDAYLAGCGSCDAARGAIEAEEATERDGTGESMKNHEEILLDEATQAMRAAAPDAQEFSTSAEKVADRLGIAFAENTSEFESCENMRPLLDAYRAGTLPLTR